MYPTTVTLERVFDVRQTGGGRAGAPKTSFSFEREAQQLDATLPGWHAVADGMTVTAVLRERDNWRTLEGWVEHGSGKLVGPSIPRTLFAILVSALAVCVVGAILQQQTHGRDGLFTTLLFACFAGMTMLLARQCVRSVRTLSTLRKIRASLEHDT